MKNKATVLMILSALALSQTASAQLLSPMMKDFSAPIIKDRTILPGDVPFGTIVFDNNANNFFGLSANGVWKQLGGGGVAGANTSLSNLGSTAINADLLPGSDNTINLGVTGNQFASVTSNCGNFGSSSAQIGDCGTGNSLTVTTDATINTVTVGRGPGSGIRNAVLGKDAMASNGAGDYNVAIGFEAMSSSVENYANVAIGTFALKSHTTGSENVAIGHSALQTHLTGGGNTAVGMGAIMYNTAGEYNTGIGNRAMINNSKGSFNVVIGSNAFLDYNPTTTGSGYNTVIGTETGRFVQTGSNNTIIGARIEGLGDISNNVILADGQGNQRIRVLADGNTGIGTTTPTTKLQVAGQITPSADDTYKLGDSTLRFTEVYATNGTINTSDMRMKKDIQESDLGLSFIEKLRPVSYRWRNGSNTNLHYGLIAQETEKAIQEAKNSSQAETIVVHDMKKDIYGLNYTELVSPIIKAIQELSGEQKSLKQDLASLKAENADLKARLEKLEKAIQPK